MDLRPRSRLRQLVLLLFLAGTAGTSADLLLVGHYDGAWQAAPLVLLALGLVAGLAWLLSPIAGMRRLFAMAMWLMIAGGAAGLWLHYAANIDFERESAPALAGADLIWKAVQGAAPPTLAPGTLIHLGLLGLVCTWRGADS